MGNRLQYLQHHYLSTSVAELLGEVHLCRFVHFSTGDRQLGPESPEAIEFAQTTNKKAGIRVSVCGDQGVCVCVCVCVCV